MLTLCTIKLRTIGPRLEPVSGCYGYWLTIGEIQRIHWAHGFSMSRTTTIPRHIASWVLTGRCVCDSLPDWTVARHLDVDPSVPVWWPDLSDPSGPSLVMMAEREGLEARVRWAGDGIDHAPVGAATRPLEAWEAA